MSDIATINYDGNSYELPVTEGSENEKAIDIGKLRAQSGLITIDPGFKNTGSTKSAITFLDGEKGILSYRGYPIEQLAEKSTFLEVAYLIIYGELPNQEVLDTFRRRVQRRSLVHEDIKNILQSFPSNAHPMGVLSSLVTCLTAFYPASLHPSRSAEAVDLSIVRILAKFPTLAAWTYNNKIGRPVNYPDNDFVFVN